MYCNAEAFRENYTRWRLSAVQVDLLGRADGTEATVWFARNVARD